MKKLIAPALTLTTAFSLAACGGGGGSISNKQDAAQAAYAVQQTGDDVQGRQSQGLFAAQFDPGGGVTTEYDVDGASGKASVKLEATVTEADVQARYTVTYDAYSSDGVDFIDGQVVYTSRVITSGADVSVSHEEKGLVTISGSQDAVLDLDVAFRVDVAGSTGSVTVVVDGTVTADGETFSYSDESLSLTAATF